MKLILLHLFTGYTIGSKVVFQDKIMTVIDFKISTPFTKGIFKVKWTTPIHFTLMCKNEFGGIETVGSKAVKDIFSAGLYYTQIKDRL